MKQYLGKGKNIGTLGDDGIFRKSVKKEKHYMKVLKSGGIDKGVLNELPPDTKIILTDKKLKTKWSTTARDWKEQGFEKNFGFGMQYFLKEDYFEIEDDKQVKLI